VWSMPRNVRRSRRAPRFHPFVVRAVRCSLVILILGLAGLRAEAQFGPTLIVTAKAEMRQLPYTLALVGTVEPFRRSTIGAEMAGLVTAMPLRQGDRAETGTVFCQLNDDLLARDLARAEARLAALRSRLEELERGTRPEVIARLRAELAAEAALAERWVFELGRVRRLQGENYANEREYQDALADQLAADSRRAAAQAELDEAVAGPRAEVIAQARHDVVEQEAVVARIRTEIEKTKIAAPFTGFVARRFAEVGNWMGVGGPVVELIDIERVLVRVDVPESAIAYATVGAPASVRIDALKEVFDGVIRHVIPQADEAARTFPVEIELPNPEYRLKAGMFARATVPAGPATEQLAVPADALIDNRGAIQVAMIVPGENGKMAIPTPVTLGAVAGGWVAITSGNLPPGAEVATYGNERLVYPQPVKVVRTQAEVDAPASAGAPPNAEQSPPGPPGSDGEPAAAPG
jgi:multidrug efflux pump subunit AcrA (membrane-fusion protein)